MNTTIKTKWLKALRSGDYKQGKHSLRMSSVVDGCDKYCCLGVLYDLHTNGMKWMERDARGHDTGFWAIDGQTTRLGEDFSDKCGISPNEHSHLMKMNDTGSTFKQIADYIEQDL